MTPAEYGEMLADQCKPLTDAQVEAAARIFVGIAEDVAA
jgi:hypothetical protein